MMALPPLLPVPDIHERLQAIFPDGTANRNYVTREIAAKTVFVMLYIGAVEDAERWVRPDQVTRMSDAQAVLADDGDRTEWLVESMRRAAGHIDGRWYAANTREPIRDETLREGLVRIGAVKEREGLPTTSPLPRYALAPEFAALFDPTLTKVALADIYRGMAGSEPIEGRTGPGRDHAPRSRGTRGKSPRDVSEWGNTAHGAGAEFRDLQGCGRGVRAAVPGATGGYLVEREPKSGGGPRRPLSAGHWPDDRAGTEICRI